jgi:hypothetical protein
MAALQTMTDPSSSTASFELLLREIEATPREYWADLLDTLRQFRQKVNTLHKTKKIRKNFNFFIK